MFVASGIASTTSGHERKKGYTFLNPSLLLGGRGVGVEIVASDQHTLERGSVKKNSARTKAAERKLRAGGNSKHNFQSGCSRKQPFGVSAVHGPPGPRISSRQLDIDKIYASLPHRTTSWTGVAILNTRCTNGWSRSFCREVMHTHRFKPLHRIFWMNRSPRKQIASF